MAGIFDTIDAVEKHVIKFLLTTDEEYKVYTENSELINREKLLGMLHPTFFNNKTLEEICRAMKVFLSEFGKLPNSDELRHVLAMRHSEIGNEELDVIFSINVARHSPDFFYKYLKAFVMGGSLERSLMGAISLVKTREITPDNIDETVDAVRTEMSEGLNIDMSTDGKGLSIYDPKSHIQLVKEKRSTGFPFFDRVLGGGWEPKTLVVIEGQPKIGKSLVLANLAVRAALFGANVGIFTVELGDRKYVKRVGSNMFNVEYELYSKFIDEDNIEPIRGAIDAFKANHPNAGELIIKEYPTGSASAIDIENYFVSLQKELRIKFDIIVVDYINLLKPASAGDDSLYSKIKKIAEELRRIAIRNMWCIVSATQVKVSYYDSSDLRLDSAAESSGLVATVDSLFGLIGEPGSLRIKIKNIANRDEGHMDSFKQYVKQNKYFRIVEDTSADSEYWSSDGGEELEKQFKSEYLEMSRASAMQEMTGVNADSNENLTQVKNQTTETTTDVARDVEEPVSALEIKPNTAFYDTPKKYDFGRSHEDILKDL